MTLTLRPFKTTFLGYDSLFDEIDRMLATTASGAPTSNFPPYNLYREEDGYTIELAVAGFKREELKVEHDRKRGLLTISGRSDPDRMSQAVLHQGIAARNFIRSFTVADEIEVTGAEMTDGLLRLRLTQVVREEDKPLLISVK